MSTIVFVGITDKVNKIPFDSSTKSGFIIDQMIEKLDAICFKCNLVDYPPLTNEFKLRYPTKEEMSESIPSFVERINKINPDILVICGKKVYDFLKKLDLFSSKLIFIYHPSYMYVYKRSQMDEYVKDAVLKIKDFLCEKIN